MIDYNPGWIYYYILIIIFMLSSSFIMNTFSLAKDTVLTVPSGEVGLR